MAKNIKIGVCDWALPGNGLFAVRMAAQFGVQALSLKIGLAEHNYPISEPTMQRYYLEEQQRYGVEYCALALNDFDNLPMHAREGTPQHEQAWALLQRAVDTANALGVAVVQVPAFAASEIKTMEDMRYSADALRFLCDELGDKGISVATENLLSPQEFEELYAMVGRENFGVYYDSQNYSLFRQYEQTSVLEGLYPYMVNQLHVKDGQGAMSGGLLGTGDSDFYGTMRVLGQKGFEGYILLENYYDCLPLRLEADSPYTLLEKDIEILKAAIAQMGEGA
jgi:sugar phosphate isomerase/epimerase